MVWKNLWDIQRIHYELEAHQKDYLKLHVSIHAMHLVVKSPCIMFLEIFTSNFKNKEIKVLENVVKWRDFDIILLEFSASFS